MNAKELKNHRAYAQLRECIELNVPEKERRPAELGLLVKRFLARFDGEFFERQQDWGDELTVGTAFEWANTPEDNDFWFAVHHGRPIANLKPVPIGPIKVKPAKQKALKRVGWWV